MEEKFGKNRRYDEHIPKKRLTSVAFFLRENQSSTLLLPDQTTLQVRDFSMKTFMEVCSGLLGVGLGCEKR